MIQKNFWFNFRDIVMKWWNTKLSINKKRMTRMLKENNDDIDIDEWIILFHNRFQKSIHVIINLLIKKSTLFVTRLIVANFANTFKKCFDWLKMSIYFYWKINLISFSMTLIWKFEHSTLNVSKIILFSTTFWLNLMMSSMINKKNRISFWLF